MSEVNKEEINIALSKVMDPEIGIPITEMKLVDKVDIRGGVVTVDFHLTAMMCPPVFAIKMAEDIKESLSKVPGVESVKIHLTKYYMADLINKRVNGPNKL